MDATESRIIEQIDRHRDEIIAFARDIYTHAELGYKEFRTSQKAKEFLEKLGLKVEDGFAITGVKGYLNPEKKENTSLALIGELDALRIPEHKYVNPETQAAHCCGHHAQLAGIIGAAIALTDPEIAKTLDGQVVFFAVPAEEYGEIEYKNQLKEQGKTIIVVLHDLSQAIRLADRLVVMKDRSIVACGAPEESFASHILEDVFDTRIKRFSDKEGEYYFFE